VPTVTGMFHALIVSYVSRIIICNTVMEICIHLPHLVKTWRCFVRLHAARSWSQCRERCSQWRSRVVWHLPTDVL